MESEEATTGLYVDVPVSLHRQLKVAAAESDTTIREIVVSTLAAWLTEREKGK